METTKTTNKNGVLEYKFTEHQNALLTAALNELTAQELLDKYAIFAKMAYDTIEANVRTLIEPLLMMEAIEKFLSNNIGRIPQKEMASTDGNISLKVNKARVTADLAASPYLALRAAQLVPGAISISKSKLTEAIKEWPDNIELLEFAADYDELLKEHSRNASKSSVTVTDRISAAKQSKIALEHARAWSRLLYGSEPDSEEEI